MNGFNLLIISSINVRIDKKLKYRNLQRIIFMKKQLDGQLNLFDYISQEEKSISLKKEQTESDDQRKENQITLYKECTFCWCSTCKHNEKGQALPRDFAGEKKPCPSCDFCIKQKKAEICEIGSYENGCKLRAEEEGMISE